MSVATDVVVVGGGLAGLVAARDLHAAGVQVVVLEARGRVGGRTLTLPAADGTPIDHGAQWIGPTQDRIAALAASVGVTTFPSWDRGLHTLFFIGSAGRLAQLIETGGGAQERRFHQGAQAIAVRLAEALGERVVLGAPVRAVRHDQAGVVVDADGHAVAARRAILTLPPALAGRIAYRPPLPAWRSQLTQRVPMGSVVKLHALYEEPFWRHDGLSGLAVSDRGPVEVVYDNTPDGGAPGVLVGFVEGQDARDWARLGPAERRAAALRCLVRYFGERAGRPRELLERSWAEEEHSGGCFAGYFPPGVWTAYGPALREPVGPLHWAGTETATVWNAHMDGAVRSGERAAAEVLAALGS